MRSTASSAPTRSWRSNRSPVPANPPTASPTATAARPRRDRPDQASAMDTPNPGNLQHRQTAADWHGGQDSALYAYASTGTVVTGLAGEIEDCIAQIERGHTPAELEPAD